MVQCVRHFVLPRLKKTLACRFLPVDHPFPAPSIEGLFFARASGDKRVANPLYQKHIIP